MLDTPEKIVTRVLLATRQPKPKEPQEARIAITVCNRCGHDTLKFKTVMTCRVAEILGITVGQFIGFVVAAMKTGDMVVVACYKSRQIAEQRLVQLEAQTPFLLGPPCHSFKLLNSN